MSLAHLRAGKVFCTACRTHTDHKRDYNNGWIVCVVCSTINGLIHFPGNHWKEG